MTIRRAASSGFCPVCGGSFDPNQEHFCKTHKLASAEARMAQGAHDRRLRQALRSAEAQAEMIAEFARHVVRDGWTIEIRERRDAVRPLSGYAVVAIDEGGKEQAAITLDATVGRSGEED